MGRLIESDTWQQIEARPDALATAFSGRQLFLSEDDRQVRREKDHDVELTKTLRSKNVTVIRCSWVLALSLFGTAGYSQVQSGQPTSRVNLAQLDEPSPNGSDTDSGGNSTSAASQPPAASAPAASADIARELEMIKLRIQQLEAQLQQRTAAEHPAMADEVSTASDAASDAAPDSPPARKTILGFYSPSSRTQNESAAQGAAPATQQESWAPFAYADWTWLNGNSREKDKPWDSKFFTPEVRFDTSFIYDFNHPRDDTLGGSTEIFRSNEVQTDQISFGGDFHWNNVRGRVLTMNGLFAVTTPRNDASPARGQWYLSGAYRYVSEAWGGYHFDVNHGLNIDAGIFVSYIGLFSYYNFDNWAYQPSYVSSNTPWFFNSTAYASSGFLQTS